MNKMNLRIRLVKEPWWAPKGKKLNVDLSFTGKYISHFGFRDENLIDNVTAAN